MYTFAISTTRTLTLQIYALSSEAALTIPIFQVQRSCGFHAPVKPLRFLFRVTPGAAPLRESAGVSC